MAIRSILLDAGSMESTSASLIRYDEGDILSLKDPCIDYTRPPECSSYDLSPRNAARAVSNVGIILSVLHSACVGAQATLIAGGLSTTLVIFGPLVFAMVTVPVVTITNENEVAHNFAVKMLAGMSCALRMLQDAPIQMQNLLPMMRQRDD